MSPRLRPLFLPQLVERRKQQQQQRQDEFGQPYIYVVDNTSSSDIVSPVTPTFSQRGGHVRYSSSTSSLDLAQSVPSLSDASSSPASSTVSPANASGAALNKTPKRPLPDVQEEPLEREDVEDTILPLYDSPDGSEIMDSGSYCLCSEPCDHGRASEPNGLSSPSYEVDYETSFMSESDLSSSPHATRRPRGRSGIESPLSGLTARLSGRLPSLSRWRSSERRANRLSLSIGSDITLENRPSLSIHRTSLSIAPSSRSSSVSGHGRRMTLDRTNEQPPLPSTPALSFYESSDSSSIPAPLDIAAANAVGRDLERERGQATTPLLPPLMTQCPPSAAPSAPQSPLEFPKMEPHQLPLAASDLASPQFFPSPALSTKPSISSFRHVACSSLSTPATTYIPEIPSPIFSLDLHDSWSDRLGHANFTVLPKPYVPEEVDLLVLQALRADWDQARVNFTKHLMRTGEHYGTTSKTYSLTEAKWAEVEQEWRVAHDSVVDRFAAICNGNGDASEALRWRRQQEEVSPSTVTRMIDVKTKFPDLGDEDIVGPMVRDAPVARDLSPSREKSASRFWRSLVGRLRLKK
ncbi:hypothetical protein MAPG_05901 [Magnaporthiopsis poae ATCC 64411]|uniref:Only prolin and serin are matching in the corresponding protein n=1 Tax=Magnaporthiopsis poae (strain ATCC 64411 / 73-15) TaxID=644358 RepID=A0A0C4E0M0_MAGP6|nr:hypothetical protein MAPG_05901 [Magnaporthiopsis poae ATCC 64411]